jgi:[acyl-carrier-protein] S-malonyltransferase
MKILCLFAGQGYHDLHLFHFFQGNEEASILLQHLSQAIELDLLNTNWNLKSPYQAQLIISAFQFCIFNLLAPFLTSHQVNLAGLSLGEVSAFLASMDATPEAFFQTISFRTTLMTSIFHDQDKFEYDLLSIRGPWVLEDIQTLCQHYQCGVSIIYSEQHFILAGQIKNLKKLLKKLGQDYPIQHHFLGVHVPSHSAFYAHLQGLFYQELTSFFSKPLHYPILNPLELRIIYNAQEEKKLLDQELYTPLQWHKLCQLIPEYQYDLIVDLGPGDTMSKQLKMMNIDIPIFTFSHFKSIHGALKAFKNLVNQ